MPELTLYHNPRCSKSRGALELLEARGLAPTIVRYLETPPDTATLHALLGKLGIGARQLLRSGEDEFKTLDLANPALSDAQLIEAMVQHPKLIERPILVVDDKAVIGRPPENVLELLP
ncbi:arsenate reductase (glutaredoxin) [Pseudomonas sp. REB1044]|uniref:arsenate reductase (glutaredoxin) n=1 Tax=Pseudomonas sp. REB1044 TaxID=2675224 RepID=UPI00315DDCDF